MEFSYGNIKVDGIKSNNWKRMHGIPLKTKAKLKKDIIDEELRDYIAAATRGYEKWLKNRQALIMGSPGSGKTRTLSPPSEKQINTPHT